MTTLPGLKHCARNLMLMDADSPWVLVCGSIAIDFVGRYDGSFAHYQDRYEIQALNISLQLRICETALGVAE
jgi:hypothetical protein